VIVDSVRVDRVLTPSSTEELAQMVRAETGSIASVGHGSQLSFGNPLKPIDCVVDTRGLARITEYTPADLTVHVEAGVRIGQLRQVLNENNQMIPLDPWEGGDVTIGGIVAANSQGPLRTVGSVRDWIIGMHVVHADGRASKTGGRVVKNVSGYDLAKLYTGSLGSLAVISEVSFKLRARYEQTATARARASSPAQAFELARALREGPFDPISLLWAGPQNEIYVRFGESVAAVEWQLGKLPDADWERFDSDAEVSIWERVGDFYRGLAEPVVRVAALPTQLEGIVRRFQPESWLAHVTRGVIMMSVGEDKIRELRSEFPTVIERASLDVRWRVPTFGLTGPEYQLMRQIKQAFDPESRLNPGRHVDGESPE